MIEGQRSNLFLSSYRCECNASGTPVETEIALGGGGMQPQGRKLCICFSYIIFYQIDKLFEVVFNSFLDDDVLLSYFLLQDATAG